MPDQNQAGHRFGTPVNADPSNIQQHYSDTCAVRCQEIILRDYGIDLTEDQAVQMAVDLGIYTPGGGTTMEDVGKLLEFNGIAVTQTSNANIFNLVNELGQGHRVIVGGDADEIWGSTGWLHDLSELFVPSGANHALIVSEIDTSDPDNVKVILTDPGTGDVAKEYTLEEFQDAWSDSNCFMVSTNYPPPQEMKLPEMANFDYSQGHLPSAFGMPWNDFSYAYNNYQLYNWAPGTSMFNSYYDMMSNGYTNWGMYDSVWNSYRRAPAFDWGTSDMYGSTPNTMPSWELPTDPEHDLNPASGDMYGSTPDTTPSWEPPTDSGSDPGTEFGTDSGMGFGTDTGMGFGTDSGMGFGTDSGMGFGTDSGMGFGTDSGFDSGLGFDY